MVGLVTISAGPARLDLAPELGGGIARLDVDGLPVLRPWQGDCDDLFSLACNVLVPFSNRISKGGFDWEGVHHPLSPNLPGQTFPIHGDGFQKRWSCAPSGQSALMDLPKGSFGPWCYAARQMFDLTETSLSITLSVTNTGADALPFGVGFHPWFPRNADTCLSFKAHSVWMEDEQHLPTQELPLGAAPDWDFTKPRSLPDTWINNGYSGWTGSAMIAQGSDAVSCSVSASENLDTALVFTRDAGSDFFCFEPVSHPVDAFHLPGHPGLRQLMPRETMAAQMKIAWRLR